MPRTAGISLGLSLAMGIIITVLSLNPHMSIVNDMAIPAGSPLPVETRILKTGEIPVDIMDASQMLVIANKQGDSHGGEPRNAVMLAPQQDGGGEWTQKADMPTARAGTCSAVVDGKIYVIGGGDNFAALGKMIVEEYDPETDTWTIKAGGPETGRALCSASVVDGRIYVIGGLVNGGANRIASALVEEYDPATNTWTRKMDMPTARVGLSTSVVNGRIYAIGGTSNPRSLTANLPTVEEYDPATDKWTRKADMLTERVGLSTSAVNGKIYAIGGMSNVPIHLSTVEEYDPTADTWTEKADMKTRRIYLSAVEVNGKVYAIGGALVETIFAKVDEYDPQTNTWTMKEDMPTAREAPSAVALDGKIYVFGGCTSTIYTITTIVSALSTVEEYTPEGWPFQQSISSLSPRDKLPTTWGEVKSE